MKYITTRTYHDSKIKEAYCFKCSVEMAKKNLSENKYGKTSARFNKKASTVIVEKILEFNVMRSNEFEQSCWGNGTTEVMFIKFADHTGAVWSGRGNWNIRVSKRKEKTVPNEPIMLVMAENNG
jgi:hypothetical protein